MIEIDASDFDALAADLTLTATRVGKGIAPVVSRAAMSVKRDWNSAFAESASFRGIAGSVTYDTRAGVGWVEAVVGPDKSRRGGALANIAHFGGAHGGGGTVADPQTFIDAEHPRMSKALSDLIEQAL